MQETKKQTMLFFKKQVVDAIFNTMILATPTIKDLLVCPVSKFITSASNECNYSGSFTEIFVYAVYPFFENQVWSK